jgi:hypothetical protein
MLPNRNTAGTGDMPQAHTILGLVRISVESLVMPALDPPTRTSVGRSRLGRGLDGAPSPWELSP